MWLSVLSLRKRNNVFACIFVLCCFAVASISFLEKILVESERPVSTQRVQRGTTAEAAATAAPDISNLQALEMPAAIQGMVSSDDTDNNNINSSTSTAQSTADSYTSPVPELLSSNLRNINNMSLPLPLQVLEQYKRWHGVEAVQRNPDGRQFSVVFYSCPIQAGNRLHHYMTGMLWSILTNRTMLYKYWDRGTCEKFGSLFSQTICKSMNDANGCDAILHRAPWIASYDEWAPRLGLLQPDEEPFELPFYSTHPTSVVNGRYPWGPNNNEESFGVDVKFNNRKVVIFVQQRFKISFLAEAETREHLLHSQWARQTAEQVYSLGADFLFGALFRYSFDLSQHMKEGVTTVPSSRDAYSIALHSRHIDAELDGCDIAREQRCMHTLLKYHAGTRPCVVMLMSDRQCTITKMTSWLEEEEQACTVQVASHESQSDYLSEHGPYAGAGFFQDLALAMTANSAFIGLRRSSSDLILESLVFRRIMDAWHAGSDLALLEDVNICLLKKIIPPEIEGKKRFDKTPVPPSVVRAGKTVR